jgi:hypothetical protein
MPSTSFFNVENGKARVHRYQLRFNAFALALAIAYASTSQAQGFPFSQRGSVGQTVAFTDITITYGRPVARGRVLFGQLVPWDSIWHPGADSATRVTFSREVLLEGRRLAAGEYSLWVIPRQSKPWTVILSRKAHVFHRPYPGSDFDALRVEVQPDSGMHMESLAIYFPVVLRDTAILRVHWGTTMLPIRIKAPYRPAHADRIRPEQQRALRATDSETLTPEESLPRIRTVVSLPDDPTKRARVLRQKILQSMSQEN